MKTIVDIIIIYCQNIESEHLLAIIIMSVFNEQNLVSAWMSSTEVTNTGLPKLPLDDLKSFIHRLAELHVIKVIAWNIHCKCMRFSVVTFDVHVCSYYNYTVIMNHDSDS